MKNRLFVTCVLVLVSLVYAERKTCQLPEFASTREKSFGTGLIMGSQCSKDCYDCADHNICGQVLNDIGLIDPNPNVTGVYLSFTKSFIEICQANVKFNDERIFTCRGGFGDGSCEISCRICQDVEICSQLLNVMEEAKQVNATMPFALATLCDKVTNSCVGVTDGNPNSATNGVVSFWVILLMAIALSCL